MDPEVTGDRAAACGRAISYQTVFGHSSDSPFSFSGASENCDAQGINQEIGREGTCTASNGANGTTRTYIVVDREHVLHMPGYTVELERSDSRTIPVSGPNRAANGYGRYGLQTEFFIRMTNTGSCPLAFDSHVNDIAMQIPQAPGSSNGWVVYEEHPSIWTASPWIGGYEPIASRATQTGWVAFLTPTWQVDLINLGDMYFFEPGDPTHRVVGEIRLWK